MQHAHRQGLLVIFDGKRNDIGSTAEAYAAAYLGTGVSQPNQSRERQRAQSDPQAPSERSPAPCSSPPADAITVNPYLGLDSLQPFLDAAVQTGTGLFVLVKTSNPGSADFQDLLCDGKPLYRHVADKVEQLAAQTLPTATEVEQLAARTTPTFASRETLLENDELQMEFKMDVTSGAGYGSVGAVVGATYPEQVAELRSAMPHAWLLLPGYGAQGASAADIAAAFSDWGRGALVNSSRAILFAHRREPYAARFGEARWEAAVEAATRDAVAELEAVG
jgi:orotidine-5'-phosphate decarboxylase